MTTGREVLSLLCPTVEYVIYGDTYDGIHWLKGEIGLSEKEFNDGFAKVETMKAKAEADKAAAKQSAQAKLAALGLTEEEVASILG